MKVNCVASFRAHLPNTIDILFTWCAVLLFYFDEHSQMFLRVLLGSLLSTVS